MRELKFRAWNGKRMLYDIAPVNSNVLILLNTPNLRKVKGNFIYMQYIGLKDKNGKEIFEGDIIVSHFPRIHCGKGIIKYGCFLSAHEPGFSEHSHVGYYIEIKHGKQPWNSVENDIDWNEDEVIGNIHENPVSAAENKGENS